MPAGKPFYSPQEWTIKTKLLLIGLTVPLLTVVVISFGDIYGLWLFPLPLLELIVYWAAITSGILAVLVTVLFWPRS